MKEKITIFIIDTNEPSVDECINLVKKQTYKNIEIKRISNVCPMWRAFQTMLDGCDTNFFVQVDADMLLTPTAIETLYTRISSQKNNTAISVGWLWDDDVERQILGVKIYNHNICMNFPYTNSLSCEMTQVEKMKRHGYEIDVMNMSASKEECLGIHFPSQNPEMAFRRWERNMIKMRKLKWMDWLSIYPQKIFKKMIEQPNDDIIRAKLFGIVSGLSLNNISDTEADYSTKNENYERYESFFKNITIDTKIKTQTQTQTQTQIELSKSPIPRQVVSVSEKIETETQKIIIQNTNVATNPFYTLLTNLLKLDEKTFIKLEGFELSSHKNMHNIALSVDFKICHNPRILQTDASFFDLNDIVKKMNRTYPKMLPDIISLQKDKEHSKKIDIWQSLDYIHIFMRALMMGDKSKKVISNLQNSVILAIDVYGWAFDNIATQVLKDTNYGDNIFKIEYTFLDFITKMFDLESNIVCFWWKSAKIFLDQASKSKIHTLLFDHYSWLDEKESLHEVVDRSLSIGVGNILLEQEIQKIAPKKKTFVLKDGVDFDLFPLKPASDDKKEFVFGWAGNSKIQKLGGYDGHDLKGVSLIKEAINRTKANLFVLDVTERPKVAQNKMYEEFYQHIDCYICASESEGTPNTVFESLACGIPVITTRVGNIGDVLIEGFNGKYINRNVDSIVDAIQYILKHQAKFKGRNEAIRDSAKHFSWRLKTMNWNLFLENILESN
jgi:glycosyltransferase involved in cell wall biosynthesis